MEPAFMINNNKLLETGMAQEEVDMLMGRFLQEETQEYIDYINLLKEHIQSKEGVILHKTIFFCCIKKPRFMK